MPETIVKALQDNIPPVLPPRYYTLAVYSEVSSEGNLTAVVYGGNRLLETSKPAIEVIRAFQDAFRELEGALLARQPETAPEQPGRRVRQESPRP